MIKLKNLIQEILDKNSILYLGWVNKTNLKVIGFDIESGEDETHHNYLRGLPPEWRGQSDRNLVRWRYRKDINTLYCWDLDDPTEEEKEAIKNWIGDNLHRTNIEYRVIQSGKQATDPNFWKSHGEDENMIKLKNLINESFRKGDGWTVYEGTNKISVIFEDGKQMSFDLTFRNKLREDKDKWRTSAASKWTSLAREIYNNPDLNEIGNPKLKSWEQCFQEALNDEKMKPFIKEVDRTPVFDPVNFTPRL